MANYYATVRTNYFKVKKPKAKAFQRWCAKRFLQCWTQQHPDGRTLYALSAENGWPSWDPQTNRDFDILTEITRHLDGYVAVFIEIGFEKLRSIEGQAIAVHPDGRTVSINISDIYDNAREAFGPDVTITEAVH
jgi:hypothetical protein